MEREGYRELLAEIYERHGYKQILSLREISDFLGKDPRTVKRKYETMPGGAMAATELARQIIKKHTEHK